jgi:6-phosphogluconolactonase
MHRYAVLFIAVLAGGLPGSRPNAFAAGKITVVYVHDNPRNAIDPNQVFAFRLNADGTLDPIAGSPFISGGTGSSCGGQCQTASYSSKSHMLFTASGNGVFAWRAAADGSLALVAGSPFGSGRIFGVAVVQMGSSTFVYGSDFNNDRVQGFKVQPGGALAAVPGSPFTTGSGPDGMTSAKNTLVVANEQVSAISAYKVQKDGSLVAAPGSPFSTGAGFDFNVNIEPKGKFVYTADDSNSQVFGLSVGKKDAALTALAGSPFASASPTSELALGVSSLFYALSSGDTVQAFRREKTGTLTALGGSLATGLGDIDAGAMDSKGKFLVLAASGANLVRSFAVNAATGALTTVDSETPAVVNVNAVLVTTP